MQTKMTVLAFAIILLALPAITPAKDAPRLYLEMDKTKVAMGQEMSADVLLKEAPLFYGSDVRLTFNPDLLEVIDANEKSSGVQIEPGDFLDPSKSFFLLNQSNNKNGSISYALSLLNPAPAVDGNGRLATIAFRAKSPGQTAIRIEKGELGTRDGKTIYPDLGNMEISIKEKLTPFERYQPQILLAAAALLALVAATRFVRRNRGAFLTLSKPSGSVT